MKVTKRVITVTRAELEPGDNSGNLYDLLGEFCSDDEIVARDGFIEVHEYSPME